MRGRKRLKSDNVAINSIIGGTLMVAVTILLSTIVIENIYSKDDPPEKNYVDLSASLVLKSELEGGGGIVEIMHKGGETLDDDGTLLFVNIDNENNEFKISDGNSWEGKEYWDISEKWSKYFANINIESEIKIIIIDTLNKDLLLKGRVQSGVSFPDNNAPIISFSWSEPSMAIRDGTVPFKLFATIVDKENNIPSSGTVTVNLLSISANEAEPMFDFDRDGVYETQYLRILNGTDVGIYNFKLTAVDSYGNKAVGDVDLTVDSLDSISPTIEITQPTINSFENSTPVIIASIADNIGGSGIDISTISLQIDGEDVPTDQYTVTSSDITFTPSTSMDNGSHTITITSRDKAGNQATTSLSFITGGYTQPFGEGGAQNFIFLDQSGTQTNNFEAGETIRIRASSAFVEDTETKNRITIYDSNGDTTIIDPAFTQISNTAPYVFQDYSYASVIDAPSEGYYKIKMEMIDSNGNIFSAQESLKVGNPSIPYYFNTYDDPNFINESNSFNSTDIVYVKIISPILGEVNNTNSENIYIEDYVLNNQIQSKPGTNAISNVTMTPIGDRNANYTFSVNLSQNDFGVLQNSNWYTLSIPGLKNQDNELIFNSAAQINIIDESDIDLVLEDFDISLSNDNPTLGDTVDITITVHNEGISDISDVTVGVWEDNELVGEEDIPLISANGGEEDVTIPWYVQNPNTDTLVIVIDPYFSITEHDETNNLINKPITIRYPILLVDDDDGNDDNFFTSIIGDININPNNSPDNEFILTKPNQSTITRDDLHHDSSVDENGVYYNGLASNFNVKPKGNSNQNGLIIDGQIYYLENKNTYYIEGADMNVVIYNNHINGAGKATGHWWINVNTETGSIQNQDDNGENWNVHIQEYWIDVLDNLGYFYELHIVPHGEDGPDYDTMINYDAVIWFTGRDNYGEGATLTSTDQSNIAMYLEDGGDFWINSQSLLYVMCGFDEFVPLTNSFAHEYLKVNNRSGDKSTENPLLGVDADPITNGMIYDTSNAIFNGDDYCDDIILEQGGEGIFYSAGANYCGVRYDSGTFKTVFLDYEFTFIEDNDDRAELVEKVLDWFGIDSIEDDVGINSLDCPDNIQNNSEINITATIKNFGKNDQYNFNVNCLITAQNGIIAFNNTKLLSVGSKNEIQSIWTWTPDIEDIYILRVTTQLDNDQDITNDEETAQINVLLFYDSIENGVSEWTYEGSMLTTLFHEDFESGNLNNWEVYSNIEEEIIDNFEFDTSDGNTPDIIHISGDVYGIVYEGNGNNGLLITVEVSAAGYITETIIDSLEFDSGNGITPDIIHISGNVYAIAYEGISDDGFLKTVEIANDGIITDIVGDTLEFDNTKVKTPHIIHVSGDVFAITYQGKNDDGFLKTIDIGIDGIITELVNDPFEFDSSQGKTPNIIHISNDIFAIVYSGSGDDGYLKTVEIATNGSINDSVIDTFEFDSSQGKTPQIIHISGNVYGIAYSGTGNDGFLKTVEIENDGIITNSVIDTLEFDAAQCSKPNIIHISNDIYTIVYSGVGDVGYLKKIEITTNGQITNTAINSMEFDSEIGKDSNIIHISGDLYSIIYCGENDDGIIKTAFITADSYDAGIVEISNNEAYSGTYSAKFYGDNEDNKDMRIQRSFNLTGLSNVYLTWYWHDEDLEESDFGYLSIWDGTWDNDVISIWDGTDEDHVTSPSNYESRGDPNLIKLDDYYNMVDGFIIRFGCMAKNSEESDCLLIDDIKIVYDGTGNLWHPVETRSYSSDTSFWCGDDNTNKYTANLNNSLISPEIDLTNGTSATLKFWQYCDFEGQTSNIDGGIVEITINDGSTWDQITPIGGYDDGVIVGDGVNPLGGLEAFCYDSDWTEIEFDLTSYLGNKINIRFRFGSGTTTNEEGWFIDDINIYIDISHLKVIIKNNF